MSDTATSRDNARVRDLEAALELYAELGWPAPKTLLVSGSGLAVDVGERTHGPVPLNELMPFTIQSVIGHPHSAEMLLPTPDNPVLYLRGRVHSYQGYTPDQVVLPVRLAAKLGAERVVMTNAAGGLDRALAPGQITLISDHINLSGLNPLRGEPPADWGPRFPDMTEAYDPALRARFRQVAEELGVSLAEGVYVGLAGPSYETPAEVRMLGQLGGHLVGMSTVLEVIAARHMGLAVAGLSLVTNYGAGVSGEPLHHDEVLEIGQKAAGDVSRLLAAVLRQL